MISESKSSRTINVEEDNEFNEDEKIKNKKEENINNNINNFASFNIYDNNNNNKFLDNSLKGNKNNLINELDKKIKEKTENFQKNNNVPIKLNNIIKGTNINRECSICQIVYSENRLFVAKCHEHFLCKKCSKNYYEDIIENGIREMRCPFIKCKQKVDLESLKNFISSVHYDLLTNNTINNKETQTKFCFAKIKTNCDDENYQLYTKKHVIDINSNKNLYNYNNAKGVYCPKCYMNSLFSKTNNHFFKCLNCQSKICKYCLKDFGPRHLDTNYTEHCKVYHRYSETEDNDKSLCFKLSLQLFFVLACYYVCFAGTFLLLRKNFYYIFGFRRKQNIILYFITYLFTFIIFIFLIPFIVIFYPYFPSIMAACDY